MRRAHLSRKGHKVGADFALFAATLILIAVCKLLLRSVAAQPLRRPSFPQSTSLQMQIARFPRVPWSRLLRLFGCKRPHYVSAALPIACGFARLRRGFTRKPHPALSAPPFPCCSQGKAFRLRCKRCVTFGHVQVDFPPENPPSFYILHSAFCILHFLRPLDRSVYP